MSPVLQSPLVDQYLPHYDFKTLHGISLEATPAQVYQVIMSQNILSSSWNRILFRLRGLPSRQITLSQMKEVGFIELGRIKNQEFLLGIVGKFWRPKGFLQRLSSEEFRDFEQEGFAKAVWEFHLNPLGPRQTYLSTETRIECLGPRAKRWFGLYWATIEPFSSLVRKEFLKAVSRRLKGDEVGIGKM